jgi:hypothetical protein
MLSGMNRRELSQGIGQLSNFVNLAHKLPSWMKQGVLQSTQSWLQKSLQQMDAAVTGMPLVSSALNSRFNTKYGVGANTTTRVPAVAVRWPRVGSRRHAPKATHFGPPFGSPAMQKCIMDERSSRECRLCCAGQRIAAWSAAWQRDCVSMGLHYEPALNHGGLRQSQVSAPPYALPNFAFQILPRADGAPQHSSDMIIC